MKPFIGLTMGDPGGIGPWIISQLCLERRLWRAHRPLIIGDAWVFRCLPRMRARVHPVIHPEDAVESPGVLNVLHVPHPGIRKFDKGRSSALSGEAAAMSLRVAATLCLRGEVKGLFTAPVSKESLWSAGIRFGGQTEYQGHLTGVRSLEMLMLGGRLRIVLVTRHLPLKNVSGSLTARRIQSCVATAAQALRDDFGIRSPRIGVCGLNPHAGDAGVLGNEERRIIQPAVRRLSRRFRAEGPFPADSLMAQAAQGAYDLVAAMYHDQAMVALKVHAPVETVNMTIGLPFPRVSPGHGTAFDLVFSPEKVELGPSRSAIDRLLSLV